MKGKERYRSFFYVCVLKYLNVGIVGFAEKL